ncbi:MAG: outer membrane beta-barrel protein [Candidatus Omnitrophica bacterium]|nr:outer membrane beta-barrel protein [Candidatus Omnitrophota bacterium]
MKWALILSFLLAGNPIWPVFQAHALEKEETASQDKLERSELFIELLKRRAQRILEAHREPPPPLVSFSSGVSQGFESNVNLDGSRKGDHFTEESASLVLRPQFTPWLSGEFSWNLLNTHFFEFRDSNLWSNTVSAQAQFKPHRALRLDLTYEYGLLDFPFDTNSSFLDQRFKTHLSYAQTPWLTHKAGWSYLLREYDTRKARDPEQNTLPGVNRKDQRHAVNYEARLRFSKTFARIGAEYYRNFSNDLFQDFYDWGDFRVLGSLTRVFSPKWLGSLSVSHERKNYQERSVPAINMTERDNLLTSAGSLIYQINRNISISYSLTYRYQDSNDPRLDFTDWIHQLGVTVGF